ncbi:hypothetical protein NKH77_44980 [Streptomyces sp. M19]
MPWWTVAVALVVTAAAAWPLTGRERGIPTVTAATVVAQSLLHIAFVLAQSAGARAYAPRRRAHTHVRTLLCGMSLGALSMGTHPGMSAHAGTHAHAGTDMGTGPGGMGGMGVGMHGMDGMEGMGGMGGMAAHAHGALGMWSAHALAALLCGLWLSGGEQAAFRLTRAVAARIVVPLLALLAVLRGVSCDRRPVPVRRGRAGRRAAAAPPAARPRPRHPWSAAGARRQLNGVPRPNTSPDRPRARCHGATRGAPRARRRARATVRTPRFKDRRR